MTTKKLVVIEKGDVFDHVRVFSFTQRLHGPRSRLGNTLANFQEGLRLELSGVSKVTPLDDYDHYAVVITKARAFTWEEVQPPVIAHLKRVLGWNPGDDVIEDDRTHT